MSWWHLRQAVSVTLALRPVIRNGSGKRPVVNASEWLNPLSAFIVYFGTSPGGV
jgi:hypothetical protein